MEDDRVWIPQNVLLRNKKVLAPAQACWEIWARDTGWIQSLEGEGEGQPLLGTMPSPSRKEMSWLAGIFLNCSWRPFGQWMSISTARCAPRPKCNRESL